MKEVKSVLPYNSLYNHSPSPIQKHRPSGDSLDSFKFSFLPILGSVTKNKPEKRELWNLMAIRALSQKKLLKSLSLRYFSPKPLNTAASASPSASSSISINLTEKPESILQNQLAALSAKTNTNTNTNNSSYINLHDAEKLFSSVSTTKLLRATANLHLASMEPIVDLGMWVMNSKLMDMEVFRDIVLAFVKHTFYEHFCAGENALATENTVRSLNSGGAGLRAMLVYAVEYASDNQSCDRNLEAFLDTVEIAKSLPPSSVSYFSWLFLWEIIDSHMLMYVHSFYTISIFSQPVFVFLRMSSQLTRDWWCVCELYMREIIWKNFLIFFNNWYIPFFSWNCFTAWDITLMSMWRERW